MAVRKISPADKKSSQTGSFSREVLEIGGLHFGSWRGYGLIRAGATVSAIDIVIPSEQRGIANTTGLIIDGDSYITSVGLRTLGNITHAVGNGKIKLAPILASPTQAVYTELTAFSNVIAAGFTSVQNNNTATWTSVGSSPVTYRLFATDGAAGAAAAASTVTASVDTKILVMVNFYRHIPFPASTEFGIAAPSNT
jgi:hypothetical protein